MRYALPLAAAGYSIYRDDREGVKQLGLSWATSAVATEGLKRAVHDDRPTGGGHGFVSGQASSAFAAASYLHVRYGLEPAVPAYALASLAAYNRVRTRHHYARQAAAGALVGIASGFLLTKPLPNGGQLALVPLGPGLSVQYSATW